MNSSSLTQWSTALRSLGAIPPSSEEPDPNSFADEFGHRRPVDMWVIAWHQLRSTGAMSDVSPIPHNDLDVRLWRMLTDRSALVDVGPIIESEYDAPITPPRDDLAIEVWTEIELACLHALWWHEWLDPRRGLKQRLNGAVTWHLEHLQPDNATNHPWGLHVFLLYEFAFPGKGAQLYAETLLSNCQVMLGHPDRFSALLLRDSATALEEHARRSDVQS